MRSWSLLRCGGGCRGGLSPPPDRLPDRREPARFEPVAVEHVERVERNDAPVRVRNVDAGLPDGTQVERKRIDELEDEHPEDPVVAHRAGRHPREAAEKIPQTRAAIARRERRREELQE